MYLCHYWSNGAVFFTQKYSSLLIFLFSFLKLLRLRRPFVAYITDAMGKELFRVRVFSFLNTEKSVSFFSEIFISLFIYYHY